jgi:ankyrin repeat protein/O-glycosyl hydrolase
MTSRFTTRTSALLLLGCTFVFFQGSALSGNTTLTINPADRYQKMDGFGTAILTYDLLPAYQRPEFYDRVVFDFGLSILRIPVGGIEWDVNDNNDPSSFAWDSISTEGMDATMEVARQFQARGVETIMATPWSPPPWMKTNRSETGGGRLRPDMREEFGEYLSAFAQAAKDRYGVEVDAISIQNELLFSQQFGSCLYNPLQLRETLRHAQRQFDSDDLETDLIVSEDMGWADRFILYLEPLMADAETRTFRGFFASHGWNGMENWRKMAALTAPYKRKLWMTETSGHTPDWQGAMALAENVHHTIAGGDVSAFVYWQIDDRTPSRWALFANGEYTAKAIVMKHFARFVRPGMERVYADGNLEGILASAFRAEMSGEIVIVLVNPGNSDRVLDLSLPMETAPKAWLVHTSTEDDFFASSMLAADQSVTVPASGIVTLYGRADETIEKLPSLRPDNWIAPPLGPSLSADNAERADERLHAAARANEVDTVAALLAEGLDPNALNIGGFAALHRAAWPGHTDVVPTLIEGGADPNQRGGSGGTPLLIAAANGRDDFIRTLVPLGADVNLADNTGFAPLHQAALGGHLETVRLLLELGADPKQRDLHGWSPLHWAAASSRNSAIEIMRVLLVEGADPSATDAEGKTPLHIAAANFVNPRAPDSRLRGRRDSYGLYLNAERLRILVEAGAPLNATDEQGRTALHWAAWIGETMQDEDPAGRPYFEYRVEGVRYLLSAGADSTLADHLGKTAADYARAEGYAETANLIENASARPWITGSPKMNPTASELDHVSPEVEQITQRAMNRRLVEAAREGFLEQVRQLLESGANPNALNDGNTALHAAVIGRHSAVVKVLLDAGADASIRDSDGYTAHDRAEQDKQAAILELLR